jgi:tetratricopeptide (TPR) repeat protein
MILLGLALLAGCAVFALVWSTFSLVTAIIPALIVAVIVYFIIARKIAVKAQAAMMQAVGEIQKGRVDRGIALLEDVKKQYGYWQFFTASAIDGQIGSLHFMRQDFARAKPYLEKSFGKHWNARAMLAILSFKKKDYAKMDKIFEGATRYSPKQGLLWSVWAYCHHKAGNNNKAIDILVAGQKKLGNSDAHLIANLNNLQNNKKMKMNGYGQEWYQFHLEPLPQPQQQVRYVRR